MSTSPTPKLSSPPVGRARVVGRARSTPGIGERLSLVLAKPSWPGTVARPEPRSTLGVDYDTSWTRSGPARLARAVLVDNVTRPLTRGLARPKVVGLEHLEALDGPIIFAANHASHFDTAVVLSSLPVRLRHHIVVAAAADHFFDRRWKAALWSFSLASIPIERTRVSRRFADLATTLITEGWSLLIFDEGGRTPDGWGQEFRGGAAHLAKRCTVPVVPVHLRGTRALLPKGGSRISPGAVELRFGEAIRPAPPSAPQLREESTRRFAARVEAAVATLADEAESDWWSAKRRAALGATPPLRGPEASPWRRSWALTEGARAHRARSVKNGPKGWSQPPGTGSTTTPVKR